MSQPYLIDFDPVAFRLGVLQVHWYGLMYLLGFLCAMTLGQYRRRHGRFPVTQDALNDLFFYSMLGVIMGGRIWYMLFYYAGGLHWIWTTPLALFRIWDGGMSFHGGLIGVLVAAWWWSHRHTQHFFDTMDFMAPLAPIGLGLGRLGNFINGELWGKPGQVPWAMIFPNAHQADLNYVASHPAMLQVMQRYGGVPRHPSELYELALEGVILFIVLWCVSIKPRPRYLVSGLFALLYGVFRSAVEFVRMPDPQLGYLMDTNWITMGQLQSLPLIVLGLILLWYARQSPTPPTHQIHP